MKKTVSILCAFALILTLSAGAFAMGPSQGAPGGNMPQMQGGPQMNGQVPQMNGEGPSFSNQNNGTNQANGQAPDDNFVFIDFEALAAAGVISEETLANIQAYLEQNAPEELVEMDGEMPDLSEMDGDAPEFDGQAPQMNGQAPQMNGQAPQMNGQAPQMNGQAPQMNGQAPQMDGETPDFSGEAPEFDGEAPDFDEEKTANPAVSGLLSDLLKAGVITEADYTAILDYLSAAND